MVRGLQRLDLLVQLLRPVVLVHWAVRRYHLVGSRILLRCLRDRWSAVFGRRLGVFNSGFLTWRSLFVVRLLVALVRHVSVRLTQVYSRLVLIVVRWLVTLRIWGGRRLHQRRGRLRRGVLALVLILSRVILRHLSISSALRRSHRLVRVVGLVALSHIFHAGTAGRGERCIACIGNRAWAVATVESSVGSGHAWLLAIIVRSRCASGLIICRLLIVLIPILRRLVLTAPHAHIASNADAAALFSDHAAQRSAFGQTWELLRREDNEWIRLDLEAVGDVGIDAGLRMSAQGGAVIGVHILRVLELLVEREAQAVLALVTDREIGEDEVAGRARTIEIRHTSNGCTSEDWEARSCRRCTAWSNCAGIFKSG